MPFALPEGGELRIDYAGLGLVMKSPGVQAELNRRAAAMTSILAEEAKGRIWVERYTTDRAVVSVTIGIEGGAANAELKTGIISDAALRAGLEVKTRPAG
jgi:hypothetical protein